MQQAWNGEEPVVLREIPEVVTQRKPEKKMGVKSIPAGIPVNIPGTLQKSHVILVTNLLDK